MNRIIVENLYRVPRDVDLIVGVPRSGVLAANLLALHLNLPLTDVSGYVAGRLMGKGMHRAEIIQHAESVSECRRVLVIDDSILTGSEMRRVRKVIDSAGLMKKTIFGAVFYVADRVGDIDLGFELCSAPREFEWNLMHGQSLSNCFVDIDGVLCVDPTDEENDDGARYIEFIRTARPYLKPSARIGTLITARLEKYRGHTMAWLAEQNIEYDNLIMMGYATMQERQAAQQYAQFKATAFARSDAVLFIESEDALAADIARISGKPAVCVETHEIYDPSGIPLARETLKAKVRQSRSFFERGRNKLTRTVRALNSGRG